LNVSASLNPLELGVKPQIDRRLWTNGKLQMMIDLVGGEALGVSKATYGFKGLEGACRQNQYIIPS
jgi:hypothetical protein